MTTSPPGRPAGTKAEGIVQICIMFAIGGAAAAASFTHVHDLAAAHRQGGWLAWADAVVLELMSLASGLEIRRRRRHHTRLGGPAAVLVCAVLMSLAAQVIQAEPSVIGWIAAAVPAAGFLTMVKIALGYHPASAIQSAADRSAADNPHPTPIPTSRPEPPPPARRTHIPQQATPRERSRGERTPRDRAGDTGDIRALLPAAHAAATRITASGRRLTRPALAAALRDDGYAVSTARLSALIRELKAETSPDPPAPAGNR